ncbi:MAG: RIP metalloprotease RseP [Bacilli bacterium]|nr:RIP metalloprotease RseP [Bacilli bacterium]
MWFISLLVFLLILGILVTIHEFGHFIVAKKCGVHIYEFSIGMGPVIHSHIGKDKIQYSIRALPIGGYVQMAGEVEEDDKKVKKDKFMCNKPWWQRILILCAGVFNNFLLAIILLFVLAIIWGAPTMDPTITEVQENSPMAIAGAKAGDTILKVNGNKTSTWDVAQIELIMKDDDNIYEIEVRHSDNSVETLKVSPELIEEDGVQTRRYGIMIEQKNERGFLASIKYAFKKFATVYSTMMKTIGGLITGKISLKSLSGPVGIYSVVSDSVKLGFEQIIYLTAFLSINLGFVNILPFPAFDGGHVLFVLIELILRRKVNQKVEGYFHLVGFILIFLLMIIVTIQDIIRLF